MKTFDREIPGFVCQEYNLSHDINRGGVWIEDFFDSIVMCQLIRGVVLVYDRYAHALTVKKVIDSTDKVRFREWLFLAMRRYAMGVFSLQPDTDMKQLLQRYELTGMQEPLSGAKFIDVIGERLYLPDDFLDGGKIFLFLCHDGSTLYIVRRCCNGSEADKS